MTPISSHIFHTNLNVIYELYLHNVLTCFLNKSPLNTQLIPIYTTTP